MEAENRFWQWSVDLLYHRARKGELEAYLSDLLHLALPCPKAMKTAAPSHLEALLHAAGDHRTALAKLFSASALLGETHPTAWEMMEAALEGHSLNALRGGNWRLAPIPCVQGDRPMWIHLLCGHFPQDFSREGEEQLREEAAMGLFPKTPGTDRALKLAKGMWGGAFLCRSWSRSVHVAGFSLELPVFLALGCAARNLPMPCGLLATGGVNPSGQTLPVAHVDEKMLLAGNMAMIVPADNWNRLEAGHRHKAFPARDVNEAWALWESCIMGQVPRQACVFLHGLDTPGQLFSLLPEATMPQLRQLQTVENVRRLRETLSSTPIPADGLRSLLTLIADSPKEEHRLARSLLIHLFDEPLVRRAAEADPALAWRLCMLHIRDCNHDGKPREAQAWLDLSKNWVSYLKPEDATEEMVSHALAVVGLLHNTYRFQTNPSEIIGPGFQELLDGVHREYERCRKRGGPQNSRALGSWHGTLAQHHAFRGEWEPAEQNLDLALQYFAGDMENLAQDLNYRFFIRLEAEKPDVLDDLLHYLEVKRLDGNIVDHISNLPWQRRPWAVFALVRFLTAHDPKDHPHVQPRLLALWEEMAEYGRILGHSPDRHPWQLILYNLGFLADSTHHQAQIWSRSARLCLDSGLGPTVHVMALLPLAALYHHGHELPGNISTIVEGIRSIIQKSPLDDSHFAAILSAPDWSTILERVFRDQKRLFPFTYR